MRISLVKCLRVMMAFLTVWCVGCSSFEPLLDQWSRAVEPAAAERAASTDESPVAATMPTDASALAASGHAVTSGSAIAIQSSAHECSCVCGHAIVPADGAARKLPALPSSAAHYTPATLLSVTRQPLVPPPIV